MISTYLLIAALMFFNRYLKQGKTNILYVVYGLVLVSIGLFTLTYTDTILDLILVLTEFIVVGLLFYLPCYLKMKDKSYSPIVFVISHVLALAILSGMRTLLLIAHPYYYLYLMSIFSTLYILKHTENKLNGLLYIACFVLIRMFIPIDIEVPLTVNFIDHSASIDNDASEFNLNESKPIIKAVEYFKSNYSGSIKTVSDIHTNDQIIILITTDINEKYRLIYKDNMIKEE